MQTELGRLERAEKKMARALDAVRQRIGEIRKLLALGEEAP